MIRTYQELDVYKESYTLALIIYQETKHFPLSEKYDLTSQLRRAAKSIPSNIAEGWAKRRFIKEFQHHLDIAIGSSNEMEVHLAFAKDLEYLTLEKYQKLSQQYQYLGGKLVNLRNSWNKK